MKQKKQPQPGTTLFDEQSKNIKKPSYSKSLAVKSLEAMADHAARVKYPNTPPHYLAPRTFNDKTANGLTNCIIQFIRLNDGQAERISNTGRQVTTRTTFENVIG